MTPVNPRRRISLLICCYNEEKTIEPTLRSILEQTRPADQIVVVNDGSTDRTLEILKHYADRIQIVDLPINSGNKSRAQEQGLAFVNGDIFVTADADTILHPDFIEEIEKSFDDQRNAAASGYVESLRGNWLTALREIDYVIGQHLYKEAQDLLGHLMVIPGCAAAFRTDIFKTRITFDHDTVTEDMDFTYKFHEMGLRIDYNRRAVVYTQDPADINSYLRQMRRWYGGGWQNLKKHFGFVFTKPAAALQSSFAYIEGVLNSFFLIILPLLSVPVFLKFFAGYLVIAFGMGAYAAIVTRRSDLIVYAPLHVVLLYLNSYVLLTTMYRELIRKPSGQLVWLKADRREVL